jgi:hypothetical protein
MNPDDLPDRVHLEALREALWRPTSRAAVLVGAGISRNADRLSAAVPEFPVWWQLAKELKRALGPKALTDDVLKLGQMYANLYGRGRLDDLLLELIPDSKYEPGEIHQRLLRLPWADVFTTNYDTLMERTRAKVPERRYDVVEIPADLARAERPRIVKLHGSFPSRRPFTFTAEDYRRYPTDFAPFINLVRQSAMENVLCLVGFSGEDPNFMQWAGWVRDQLGSTAPKMYLCGAFDLSTPERVYYQHMQVVPVDIGPIFPKDEYGAGGRHPAALEWLLDILSDGEPLDRSAWPNIETKRSSRRVALRRVSSKPLLAQGQATSPQNGSKAKQAYNDAALQDLFARWRCDRESYPGWAVCPEIRRRWLAHETRNSFWHLDREEGACVLESMALLPRADALREIAWRAEVCLAPLPERAPTMIEALLQAINPRPRLIHMPTAGLTCETTAERVDWDHLAEVWVALAFALVRYAWQFQDLALHERWMSHLKLIAEARADWRARWWYEKCWHHLVRLEFKEGLQAARDWPLDESLPFWQAKRAAVLGELGSVANARDLAARALLRVQLGRDRSSVDYQSLSDEGWIYLLQSQLDGYARAKDARSARELRDRRLRELSRDHCNPWDDLRAQERAVLEERTPELSHTTTRAFDPGYVRRGFSSRPATANYWAPICTAHDGAILPRKNEGYLVAIERVWESSPRLALGMAVRAHATSEFEEGKPLAFLVDRAAVARLPKAEVDALFDWLLRVLRAALADRQEQAIADAGKLGGDSRIELAAEVLSRLALRLNDAQLADLFGLASVMYVSPVCREDRALHGCVTALFDRTIGVAPPWLLRSWLPGMIQLPVAGEQGFATAHDANWPDPFDELNPDILRTLNPIDTGAWRTSFERLLALVREEDPEPRRRACKRLLDLALAGMLTPVQADGLVAALKEGRQGYPAHVGVLPWVLLKLPYGSPDEVRHLIVDFLASGDLDARRWCETVLKTTTFLAPRDADGSARPRLTWTPTEALALLEKLAMIWGDPERDIWLRRDPELPRRLCEVLSEAIVPFLDPTGGRALVQVQLLVDDIRKNTKLTACAWPALLLLGGAEPGEAADSIYRALLGLSGSEVQDAAFALPAWMDLGQAGRVEPPPAWLVDALVAAAETGRQPGLTHILDTVAALLERKDSVFSDRQLESIARGVNCLREAMMRNHVGENDAWDDDGLPDAEQMAVIAEASELAATLAALYQRRRVPEPDAIGHWRTYATAHPLPEVRRPWLSGSDGL